jgi:hypothetical protein
MDGSDRFDDSHENWQEEAMKTNSSHLIFCSQFVS